MHGTTKETKGRSPKPVRPDISRFPLPMSARRARFEAERAALCGWRLPPGHPYALLPRWVPYPLARGVGLVHRMIGGA